MKPPVVRRTISAQLQSQRGWSTTTKVDGSVIVTMPPGSDAQQFAKEVRTAVQAMGYTPRLGISGRTVVVTTPETLAQAQEGRGVHGASAARLVASVARPPRPHGKISMAIAPPGVAPPRDLTAADVSALAWVKALRPTHELYRAPLSPHADSEVWHVDVEFSLYSPTEAQKLRWADDDCDVAETWRKRPLVVGRDSGCDYSCGEVELTARLRSAGMQAFWMSEWSAFPHVGDWESFCVKRSELSARVPALHARDLWLRTRARAMGIELGGAGGHPDVVAWSDPDATYWYIEYKGPGDEIKPKQSSYAHALTKLAEGEVSYVAVKASVR